MVADTNEMFRLSKAITGYVWSPCIWRDGVRRQEMFMRADWCVLDFDDGEMSLAEAERAFCDTIHFIGTTRSHRKEKGGVACDRFRVAVKFERSILNLRDYRYTMAQVIKRYPVDTAPKDGARFFFPCRDIVQMEAEGYTEDVKRAPDWFERPPAPERYLPYKRAGTIPPLAREKLIRRVPVGHRNTSWFCFAKDLGRCGYEAGEILALIVKSATYGGKVTPDLAAEITNCIRNGLKALERERDGRNDEAGKCYPNQPSSQGENGGHCGA